jgi:hypothetical protein
MEANAGLASYEVEEALLQQRLGERIQAFLRQRLSLRRSQEAVAFINELPSAEQAKLHNFMGKLGHMIDAAKDDGIEVDYLNPLLDTMKRLSENVITYQPAS